MHATAAGQSPPRPAIGNTILTVIGESLVDIISDPRGPAATQAHPGGSPLNVAVGAARLGLQTSLVTHYAEDRHGLMIEEHLRSNGVQVINGGSSPTSTALAMLGPGGAAEYAFSITWEINGASLPALAAVEASTHVHTGSIATLLAPGDQTTLVLVEAAREHATISYDPNCRPAISPDAAAARQQAEVLVAASDIVKASDEDLSWLYPGPAPGGNPGSLAGTRAGDHSPDPRSRRAGHPLRQGAGGGGSRTHHRRRYRGRRRLLHGRSHLRARPTGSARGRRQRTAADPDPGSAACTRRPRQPRRGDHLLPAGCRPGPVGGTRSAARRVSLPGALKACQP